jgi:hypothetical protein
MGYAIFASAFTVAAFHDPYNMNKTLMVAAMADAFFSQIKNDIL